MREIEAIGWLRDDAPESGGVQTFQQKKIAWRRANFAKEERGGEKILCEASGEVRGRDFGVAGLSGFARGRKIEAVGWLFALADRRRGEMTTSRGQSSLLGIAEARRNLPMQKTF